MPGFPGTSGSRVTTGPVLGVHKSVVQLDGAGSSPATIAVSSASGSNVYVVPGFSSFGDLNTPTDNKGNTYTKYGTDQAYSGGQYPGYGIRTYAAVGANGGASHTTSVTKSLATGEYSQSIIEVLKGTSVAVTQGNVAAPGQGISYSSPAITVTSPAVLLSCWSGDGGTQTPDQSVTPAVGWALLEYSFIGLTAYVQFAIAYKIVTAGTYSHTWLPTVDQGAAMMMIAVT